MARFRKPKLELTHGSTLAVTPAIRKLTDEHYAAIEAYIRSVLPRSNPLTAHPDDLFFVGNYYKSKAGETGKASDLRIARRFLAAAAKYTGDIGRNRALCWYADSLLHKSTQQDRGYGLRVLQQLAEAAHIEVAADAAFLLMSGYSQNAFVARRRAIKIAEQALARYVATVKELRQEIKTIRDDLAWDERWAASKTKRRKRAR